MRRPSRSRRGATLVEALVAVAVLGVGTAAVTELVGSISNARRKLSFQTSALDRFNRLNAEIQASTCVVFPGAAGPTAASADAALMVPAATWQNAPVGAHVQTVGDMFDVTPPVRVEYQLALVPPNPALTNDSFAFDVTVRVRELTRDAATDGANITSAHYIKTWPIRKACPWRATADTRGGFP
jgi:type II secretory pathway pseudopilin PulG